MAKFYNEIVIDMNPESSTFEKTIHEDSFEYSGEIMHLHDKPGRVHQLNPQTNKYEYANVANTPHNHKPGEGGMPGGGAITKDMLAGLSEEEAIAKIAEVKYGWIKGASAADQKLPIPWSEIKKELYDDYGEIFTPTEYGASDIGKDDFVDPDTDEPYDFQTVVNKLIAKFPDKKPEDIRQQVADNMPKYQGVDPEAEGFITEGKEIRETELIEKYGEGGTEERARELKTQQAGDVYELGKGAAERAYGAAGDVYGAAQETYGLGVSAAGRGAEAATEQAALGRSSAGRGLQQGLGDIQAGAGKAGAAMRGAYGGMGGGMRGAMGAQASMAKGLESTYGAYTDKMKGISGELGRAKGAAADEMTRLKGGVGRAESAYGRAGGARTDELTRLGQEKGYAETQYGVGGIEETRATGAYEAGMGRADLAAREQQYGLEQAAETKFEGQIAGGAGSFIEGFAREGGRVPSKESFSHFLQSIPDAGGS